MITEPKGQVTIGGVLEENDDGCGDVGGRKGLTFIKAPPHQGRVLYVAFSIKAPNKPMGASASYSGTDKK